MTRVNVAGAPVTTSPETARFVAGLSASELGALEGVLEVAYQQRVDQVTLLLAAAAAATGELRAALLGVIAKLEVALDGAAALH